MSYELRVTNEELLISELIIISIATTFKSWNVIMCMFSGL